MKRILCVLVCLLMIISCGTAVAEEFTGYVLANSISVRVSPNTNSTKLYSAKCGSSLTIIGETGEWYIVDLLRSGLQTTEGYGYVRSCFVSEGFYIQISNGSVLLYRDPWSGKDNGERTAGESLLVTYETDEWLVVQTNRNTAGTSFIRKADIGLANQTVYTFGTRYRFEAGGYITTYGDRWMVMYDSDGVSVGIRVEPDLSTEMLHIIHSGDIVNVIRNEGEFAYIVYEKPNGQLVYGWVRTRYFVPASE